MASLSTYHQELVVWDDNLVKSGTGRLTSSVVYPLHLVTVCSKHLNEHTHGGYMKLRLQNNDIRQNKLCKYVQTASVIEKT